MCQHLFVKIFFPSIITFIYVCIINKKTAMQESLHSSTNVILLVLFFDLPPAYILFHPDEATKLHFPSTNLHN